MKRAYQMIAVKHTGNAVLQGDHGRVFKDYKDYLTTSWATMSWALMQGIQKGRPSQRLLSSWWWLMRGPSGRRRRRK